MPPQPTQGVVEEVQEHDPAGVPTARLWRADDRLRFRRPDAVPLQLRPVEVQLARLGITHVMDVTPDLDSTAIETIGRAMRAGALPQQSGCWTRPWTGRCVEAGCRWSRPHHTDATQEQER